MTLKTVQAIRHIGFEDLGSFADPLTAAGYDIEYIDVAERDPATVDPLGADLLVVLGGPIGVYDHDSYPVLTGEMRLLRARLAADRPTLGICLGAQLMAAALGARVYPGPAKEIGWSALDLSDAVAANPLAVLRNVAVLHWHGDTFDLPKGGTLLASTPLCMNQAFSRGPNVLGLQFHPEVQGARFEHWLLGHASELAAAGIDPGTLRRDAGWLASALEGAGAILVAGWLSRLTL
ncbi:glutamine amidotransferase [Kaistia dalseonensis]|uniref:GMP synthase (Glutamine-hydrolyzing) n=1 Tax=Kaistia dalseonensis TaxID=410840 RepID=A0ABU0H9H9_9HYPH|nr:glutamine amidotransferase [Kaistia dalseonensis]MCX5496358.1 glutamine amidotransferase [Kaistia dalseonensis]MDQ0438978.1 GMP synthase (glutamine-hydrolyzing) [Kaistia dalseonensis]